MNRQAVRSALGRAAAPHTTAAPARGLPLSTPTPTTFFPSAPAAVSRFTTTGGGGGGSSNSSSSSDNNDGGSSSRNGPRNAAVQKLAQLNRTPRNLDGVLADLKPRTHFTDRTGAGVDARSLRVALAGGPDAPAAGRGKVVWSQEEQAVIDRLEKGEVVPFEPSVTVDSLAGYGAAMATDASLGQVESAMRLMRLMTGGMAFNAESGVTADLKVVQKRYMAKMPIFVHSKEEKAWIESANPRLRIAEPNDATKKAIIGSAILGHYETHGFADIKNVKGTMANYHSRTFTYMGSDAQKFADKVLSLLPAQGTKKPAAAPARK
ncbi:hypothetical protein C8A05DRAFT_12905 [Staphylotrichum tortipilum]|uniref:Uncharacterized protein n=1 Tax=Staphylotrichum tortipilum TaxID=2831512 RepID=A0AAN6MRQ9_9PEZI|nr:hypothetical protein C8A05DRAFT_12905 [Staphylotrichum longicolle]